MGDFITAEDLEPFADIEPVRAAAMIEDAEALAVMAAPCIADDEFAAHAALKAILRGAILRWHDAGSGAAVTQSAGPFAQTLDTRQVRKSVFWPSEIQQLSSLCKKTNSGKAFAIDTASVRSSLHGVACSVQFGAAYCDCGADISGGGPLYGD